MRIDPPTKAFLDGLSGPPISTLSPAAARDVLAKLQGGRVPASPADVEDFTFPVGPTGKVPVRVFRSQGITGRLPVVVYLHGGGWVLGDLDTHDRLARELATRSGTAILLVHYDRAPEATFPIAIEQALAVAQALPTYADRLRIDPTRLVVAGDSAGGNLAIATALLAAERGGPAIRAQVLFYPVTDADFTTGSYQEFADGPWLTRASMQWFWDAYLPDGTARANPMASPLRASLDQLRGMPPTLLIVGENDVLRDEGEAYAARLASAGVPVTSVRYNFAVHDFVMLNGLRDTPAARGAVAQASEALKAALHQAAPVPELAPA